MKTSSGTFSLDLEIGILSFEGATPKTRIKAFLFFSKIEGEGGGWGIACEVLVALPRLNLQPNLVWNRATNGQCKGRGQDLPTALPPPPPLTAIQSGRKHDTLAETSRVRCSDNGVK